MMHLGNAPCLEYPLAISWQIRTLNNSSLSFIKAPWFWWIREGSTSFSLTHNSLAMHLYMTLQHEIGLNSLAFVGLGTFGSKISFVSPRKLGIVLVEKKCWITSLTNSLVIGQVALKKPLLNPSGPGDFVLGIENIADLIFWSVKGAHSFICCSTVRVLPSLITLGSSCCLAENYLPSRFL